MLRKATSLCGQLVCPLGPTLSAVVTVDVLRQGGQMGCLLSLQFADQESYWCNQTCDTVVHCDRGNAALSA